MTWADTWGNLKATERRRDQVRDRPRPIVVSEEPVPWMEPGEDLWAWKVRKALPRPLNRPYFKFVVSEPRRRRALDDYIQSVYAEMSNQPLSLWAKIQDGERGSLTISDTSPAFPPKFERLFAVELNRGTCEPEAVDAAIAAQELVLGSGPVGVHVTLPALRRDDFEFGGNVRALFDGLSTLLGGDLNRQADGRIEDLRVVRDKEFVGRCEVRLWAIHEPS